MVGLKPTTSPLSVEQEEERLRFFVDRGVVDGTTGKQEYTVDGFTAAATASVLEQLHLSVTE